MVARAGVGEVYNGAGGKVGSGRSPGELGIRAIVSNMTHTWHLLHLRELTKRMDARAGPKGHRSIVGYELTGQTARPQWRR